MKTVPEKTVERVWRRVNDATPEDGQAMLGRMMEEQPFIGAYLLAMEEVLMPPEERGGLLIMGLIVWQALSTGNPGLAVVTQEQLEAAESANIRFLEELEAGSEMAFAEGMARLLDTYNQSPLLGALLEGLMSDHAEDPEAAPDVVGMALLHLKTVLDALDQAGPQAPASE
ncbi:MAG: hypothetical protein RJA22_1338 [Verrucomicrobiota bacterium]|jgi:hypothetical protein